MKKALSIIAIFAFTNLYGQYQGDEITISSISDYMYYGLVNTRRISLPGYDDKKIEVKCDNDVQVDKLGEGIYSFDLRNPKSGLLTISVLHKAKKGQEVLAFKQIQLLSLPAYPFKDQAIYNLHFSIDGVPSKSEIMGLSTGFTILDIEIMAVKDQWMSRHFNFGADLPEYSRLLSFKLSVEYDGIVKEFNIVGNRISANQEAVELIKSPSVDLYTLTISNVVLENGFGQAKSAVYQIMPNL